MRKILFFTSALLFCLNAQAGLLLNGSEKPLSNDLFSKYQWYLKNQRQTVTADLTDIEREKINGRLGADIGWSEDLNYDALMQRDTVVAIIDSGIDWNHDELKDSIAKNDVECDNGTIPLRPTDRDKNGFPGDCIGWDFTAPEGKGQRPTDEAGHGTHLSGIIAAKPDNGIGIRGLSGRVKILPLKVQRRDLDKNEISDPAIGKDIALRVSKAIDYAVLRKVDVINLSLGWPLHLNTDEIRASFKRAHDAGIFVVSAPGNNSNSGMLYPCGFEGVACVAGMGIDGALAEWTNYGGHVDFSAPGDEILSTIPNDVGSYFFSIKGYELKSGSSQAAAVVSGIAAILKGIRPSLTPDELYKVLVLGTTHSNSLENDKFVLHGSVNLAKSLAVLMSGEAPQKPIYPNLKGIGEAVLDKNKNAQLTIPLIGVPEKIQVEEISGFGAIPFERSGGVINLNIKNPDLEHDQRLRLKISLDDKVFFHDIYLLQDALTLPGTRTISIDPNLGASIATVRDPFSLLNLPEYYASNVSKEGATVSLARETNGSLQTSGSVFLPDAKRVLYVEALDANLDGSPDYLILAQHVEADKKPSLRLHFFNSQLQPLYGRYSSWLYYPESVVMKMGQIRFFPWTHPQLGRILIPMQAQIGGLPDRDQDHDPWVPKDESRRNHPYYFLPVLGKKGMEVQTRVFDSASFLQDLKNRLALPVWGDFLILDAQSPASTWADSDRIEIYLGYGVGDQLKYYSIDVRLNGQGMPELKSTLPLSGLPGLPLYQLFSSFDQEFQHDNALALFRILSENSASWLYHLANGQTFTGNVSIPMSQDRLQGPVLISPNNGSLSLFFATSDYVVEQRISPSGETTSYKRPLTRVSFLPGGVFNEMLYPLALNTPSGRKPVLYVDASDISYRAVYLIEANANGLIAPIRESYYVPENCKLTNPSEQGPERKNFTTMFCVDSAAKPYLLHFPLGQ